MLIENIKDSINTISSIMLIVAGSFLFSRIITLSGFSNKLVNIIPLNVNNAFLFLLLLNIILLFLGMIMEGIAALAMVIPVVIPVAKILGIDLVHMGVVMVYNLMLGLITPSFGEALFVLVKIGRISFTEVVNSIKVFYPYLVLVLFLITYFPFIVLMIPNIIFRG